MVHYVMDGITNCQSVLSKFYHQDTIDPNSSIGVAIRFAMIILLTYVWSRNVGHPPVFVRNTVVQAQQEQEELDGDELTSTQNVNNGDDDGTVRVSLLADGAKQNITKKTKSLSWLKGSTFEDRYKEAREYIDSLAKPMGSLGSLEDWAARLAAISSSNNIINTFSITKIPAVCLIFVGDHWCC